MNSVTTKPMQKKYRWEITNKLKKNNKVDDAIKLLMEGRGLLTEIDRNNFLNPPNPQDINISALGLKKTTFTKILKRIAEAKKKDETVIIYGDYDADGICATAILWETLYALKLKCKPYIPDRFSEGYGLNSESVEALKKEDPNLKLIITVDNGIVAYDAVKKANSLGIDVIITDHHEKSGKTPPAYCVLHSTKAAGAGLSWFLAREIRNKNKALLKSTLGDALDLAAIGTIADQVPLMQVNRSIAKFGLLALNSTDRPGLVSLMRDAGIKGVVGVYEVGFILAPRINAMGRLEKALDSLRFLCTTNEKRAEELAKILNETNQERQKIVEEVVTHARSIVLSQEWKGVIVVNHETYHEGIIGLAASKIVEEFYRPTIVISQGELTSKASARSVQGFNIIENIRKVENLTLGGGGHPMAAGFSIETSKITEFKAALDKVSIPLLTEEVLKKRLVIDLQINFSLISNTLIELLKEFEPTGIANPTPVFMTEAVRVLDARTVGKEAKHLKLVLEEGGLVYDAIAFNMGHMYNELTPEVKINIAYTVEVNEWRNKKTIQLKVKDIVIK